MNHSFTKSLMSLTALAAVTACSSEFDVFADGQRQVVVQASSAGHSSPVSTRTQVGGIAEDGSLIMQWSANEKIGVFGTTTQNQPFTSNNKVPYNVTTFSGTLSAAETPKYAYYPYVEGTVQQSAIPVNIPTEQTYTDVTSVAQYDYKAGVFDKSQSDGSYRIQFKQMATVIRIQVNLASANGLSLDEKLQKIEMKSTASPLTGSFSYNIEQLNNGLVAGNATDTKVVLHMANQPSLSQPVTAYAVIAPGCQQNETLNFVITTDKHQVTFTSPLLATMQAGVFYDLPLNATVLTNNKAEIGPRPADPAEEETANCYMINKQGEHSFLATQIGNGDKGIIPNAGFHVTTSKINPQSAKLMWQDTPDFIDAQTVELRNGRVYYTANNNVGNAQIAVYSGPNCTGDILWSWHIWGVGDTMPTDEEVTNQAGAKFQVMDRALGALAMPVYGSPDIKTYTTTLYQWGRKDPIPNNAVYYVDGKQVDITTSYPVFTPQTEAEASILNSVRHCNKIMNDNEATGNCNWLGQDNPYLWGNIFKKGPAGMNSPEAGAGWTHVKTIYDPSPVGYRVPNRYAFTGFAKLNDGTGKMEGALSVQDVEQYTNFVVETFKDGTIERGRPKFQNGYFFKCHNKDTKGMYFPMAGCRFAGTGERNNFGVSVDYWNSTQQVNKHRACKFSIGAYEWKDKDVMDGAGNHGSYDTDDSAYKWVANPVRCVRE